MSRLHFMTSLFSLAMVQIYSVVMGMVYGALNERFG